MSRYLKRSTPYARPKVVTRRSARLKHTLVETAPSVSTPTLTVCSQPDDVKCEKSDNIGISEHECRILLIGKSGAGKSTTGNTILGKYEFESAPFADTITSETKLGKEERFGRKLLVVDTPGVYHTMKTNEEVLAEITKCYGMTSPGLHAIVLVVRIGRFTEEDTNTLRFFLDRFGEDVINFLMIAFTGKEVLERDNYTIDEYVDKVSSDSDLKKILKRIQNRYIGFGYTGKQEEREEEVKRFLEMINSMDANNGEHFYTNEMYKEAEKIISKKWEEEKRIENEKIEKRIDNLRVEEKEKHDKERNEYLKEKLKQQAKAKLMENKLAFQERRLQSKEERERYREKMRGDHGQSGFFESFGKGISDLTSRFAQLLRKF